jgi:hypothetical protein
VLYEWNKFYDTSCATRGPLNPHKLKVTYEVETETEFKVKSEKLDFSSFIMLGIPCNIRRIIYPILLRSSVKGESSITKLKYFEKLEAKFDAKKKKKSKANKKVS